VATCDAVGYAGALVSTTDAGVTWIARRDPLTHVSDDLLAVSCPGPATCYAAGGAATVAVTTDGGKTLRRQPTPLGPYTTLYADACPTVRVCYAAGAGGAVAATTDAGHSWRAQVVPRQERAAALFALACPTPTVCYAVGEGGTIVATTDGGRTWAVEDSGTRLPLDGIACPDARDCVAVGGDADHHAIIVGTADGGRHWEARLDESARQDEYDEGLVGVACPTARICYAIGASYNGRFVVNLILDSTDGGHDWQTRFQDDISDAPGLLSIACADAATCLIGGEGGAILRLDGSAAPTGSQATLSGLACPSARVCYAVGDHGTFLSTTTGGASWKSARLDLIRAHQYALGTE